MSTAKIHEFDKSLLAEKKVLAQVADFWKGRGFRQVTDEVAFQALDVDFTFTPAAAGRAAGAPDEVWVELKADGTPYNNIFLELVSNGSYGVDTPGCFMFSQAYAWAYVFDTTKEIIVFELQAVRDWVFKNFLAMKDYLKATTNKKDDNTFSPTIGIAFPVEQFFADLSASHAVTYARLPGFGQPVDGRVPRPRMPARFAHLDRGLEGIVALLNAAPAKSAPTTVKQFRAHTSRLRHKIIPLKMLAMNQTNKYFDSLKEKALGPHFAREGALACA